MSIDQPQSLSSVRRRRQRTKRCPMQVVFDPRVISCAIVSSHLGEFAIGLTACHWRMFLHPSVESGTRLGKAVPNITQRNRLFIFSFQRVKRGGIQYPRNDSALARARLAGICDGWFLSGILCRCEEHQRRKIFFDLVESVLDTGFDKVD